MLLMLRSQWEAMKPLAGQHVSIEVAQTPLAGLVTGTDLAAAVAERNSDYEATVTIYRRDPTDLLPINVDKYLVWERFPDDRDFLSMVNTASTSDNANMRGFLADHVFFVKEKPGPDHWLPDLPVDIVVITQRRVG